MAAAIARPMAATPRRAITAIEIGRLYLGTLYYGPGRSDGGRILFDSMSVQPSQSRRSFERLDQRPRREWLGEIGEAPGLKRGLANGGFVVSSHVDDRHRYVGCFETVSEVDT